MSLKKLLKYNLILMETSNPIMPPLQNIGIPKVEASTIEKVKTFLSNKRNLGIISVVIIGCLYFAYKKNLLNFIIKKGHENIKKTEETNNKFLDIDKDYNILDENNNPIKINLKEMIVLHNHYLDQERITLENHQKHIKQQQMMHQQIMQQQMMEEQMQEQIQEKIQEQRRKVKPPRQEVVVPEEDSDDLSNNELELLKRELAELELQNQNIN